MLSQTVNHPHLDRLLELVAETRQAAANIDHEWDKRAIEWQLTPDSVVFEVGSYKGRWGLQIAERYNPRLFCFEPQVWAWDVTRHVLEEYNARVFNFALGDRNGTFPMGEYETDGCSFLINTRQSGQGEMRNVAEVVQELGITQIDLALFNIEGYEHVLIPYMLRHDIKPDTLLVQTHGDDTSLRLTLNDHYTPLWDYGHTLSAWELTQ